MELRRAVRRKVTRQCMRCQQPLYQREAGLSAGVFRELRRRAPKSGAKKCALRLTFRPHFDTCRPSDRSRAGKTQARTGQVRSRMRCQAATRARARVVRGTTTLLVAFLMYDSVRTQSSVGVYSVGSGFQMIPLKCPACETQIRHESDALLRRLGAVYRCHVCRVELIVDAQKQDLMVVAPAPSARSTTKVAS